MSIDPNSDIGKLLSDETFWRAESHKTIREKTDELLIELEILRAKLVKAEKVVDAFREGLQQFNKLPREFAEACDALIEYTEAKYRNVLRLDEVEETK